MNAMRQNRFRISLSACLFSALVVALFTLAPSGAHAAASLYENDAVVIDPSPIPDATNYLNTGVYEVTFPYDDLYKAHDTLNFTNTGYMSAGFAISGIPISAQIFGNVLFGECLGYQFDNYSTSANWDYEASSFDNENTIECAQQCIVWATNIFNPGWIFVDNNLGMMQFTGTTEDLSDAFCYIAGGLGGGAISINAIDQGVGVDTNGDWQPSLQLGANSASSSEFNSTLFPKPGFQTLDLPVSTSYFYTALQSTNGIIYWAPFVQDLNPSTPYNVYFGANPIGPGVITVGWSLIYTNIATGILQTNYLYLNDEPEPIDQNGSNAVQIGVSGIPNNYTFLGSATPLLANAATAGYTDVFNTGVVTDNYSYVEAQFISTTVPTNSLVQTNVSAIAGRVMINAAEELNLNNAEISGENYINLTCTNQFDGTGGATVGAAYSDIALGVTNGNLIVSNVVPEQLAICSGTVQAWSTHWLNVVSNTVIGFSNSVPVSTNTFAFTNDYRVELVNSDISPTTPAQVQNLTLLGTNSVVLSDTMNVFGSLYVNAQSLTLTTNGIGVGAESEMGALNVENNNILWPTSFPNLHWLTNNGAISLGNLANFGTPAIEYVTNTTPMIPGTAPIATLSGYPNTTTNGLKGKNVVIGTNVYVFESKITNTLPNQVKIALTFSGTMSNLIAAINRGAGRGTNYSTNTQANAYVTAGKLTNMAFTVTGDVVGTLEDSVVLTNSATNVFWNSAFLFGGTNTIPATTNIVAVSGPYGAFVNNGAVSDNGSQIYANYFENSGVINNGANNFNLNCIAAVITNGIILTYQPLPPYFTNGLNGNISIAGDSLVVSNAEIAAGGGLNFLITNDFSDTIPPYSAQSPTVTNGSIFYSDGSGSLTGINLPVKPAAGDLLGSTMYLLTPPPNKPVKNIWAGQDFGKTTNGYYNNTAIGQLILDVTSPNGSFYFTGVATNGTTNAIYVDRLELLDYASYANGEGQADIPTLNFNTNLVIYYADAMASSAKTGGPLIDVSSLLNGSNTNRLRWVPQYLGYFSATNVVYPDGSTNTVNIGLVDSPNLDSNGDGYPNDSEPDPIFVSSQVNFMQIGNELIWDSIPSATNFVFNSPDMSTWTIYTNFVSPSIVPPVNGWPITNTLFVPPSGFYKVGVSPNNADVYGN